MRWFPDFSASLRSIRPVLAAMPLVLVPLLVAGCDKGANDTDTVPDTQTETSRVTMHPNVGGQGTSMDVHLTANVASFKFGDTSLSLGDGITVDQFTVEDTYNASATISIDPDAALGARDANLTVAGETSALPDGFEVIAQSFRIEPNLAKMGETVDVAVVGTATDWRQGYTWPGFGDDVTILDFQVLSESLASARIAIAPDARPGPRDVSMEDGPQVVTLYNGFTVDRAVITAFFDPPQGYQGDTVEFTITGLDTDFSGSSQIAFWDDGGFNGDIEVTELHVIDAKNMYGRMHLSNAARIGMRDVYIASGDETILVPDGFEVLDAPPDLSNVAVGLAFYVDRAISNDDGSIAEAVTGYAYFVIPLDPPCGSPPPPALGPMPYDMNGVFPSPPPPVPEDCPNAETVSAGDFVWFEGPDNVVTLDKDMIASTGQIIYRGIDLKVNEDYLFDQMYDLHTQGDPDGVPEVIVPKVQPTVPADYFLTSPQFVNDLTWSRGQDFTYTWTPAQTYPEAFFITQISGQLAGVDDDGDGVDDSGFAGSIPWDDGVHTYTAGELSQLDPGPVSFAAVSYIKGPYFGLPFSTIQTCQSDSSLTTSAQLILE